MNLGGRSYCDDLVNLHLVCWRSLAGSHPDVLGQCLCRQSLTGCSNYCEDETKDAHQLVFRVTLHEEIRLGTIPSSKS
jgi:hypothetical protein